MTRAAGHVDVGQGGYVGGVRHHLLHVLEIGTEGVFRWAITVMPTCSVWPTSSAVRRNSTSAAASDSIRSSLNSTPI